MNLETIEDALTLAVNDVMAFNETASTGDALQYIGTRLLLEASGSKTTPDVSQATPTGERVSKEWSVADWLASEGIHQTVAKVLLGAEAGSDELDELEAMRKLGRMSNTEETLQHRLVAVVGALSQLLVPKLKELAMERTATSGEQQEKFSQDTKGMLEYGSLSVFYGGLEALIGTPRHNVRDAMKDEHTNCGDSKRELITENYGMRTDSATEWAFVAEPESRMEHEWPVEEKLVRLHERSAAKTQALRLSAGSQSLVESGAEQRKPLKVSDLDSKMKEANTKLQKLGDKGDSELIIEEAFGLRLYTGPLYAKYNAVLRGLNSEVPFLQMMLVDLCADKCVLEQLKAKSITFVEAKTRINTYTTSLHVVNSGIVKMSKLTFASKVFRGVSGMALPPTFWNPNQHGVRGGIESSPESNNVTLC